MKTSKFLAIILFATLLNSCESPQQPQPPKNNGPTLESQLCGVWHSEYLIPTRAVSLEYSYPQEYKGTTVIFSYSDNEIFYRQYNCYTGEQQHDCLVTFIDTIHHQDMNIYSGTFMLCDSIEQSFLIKQDTLQLYHISTNGDDIIGGPFLGFIKDFD